MNDIPDIKPEHIKTFKVLTEYADLLMGYDESNYFKREKQAAKKVP